MEALRYIALSVLLLVIELDPSGSEDACRHTTVVPGYRPLVSRLVTSRAQVNKGVSVEACSRLCCQERCTMAYARNGTCVRLTCTPADPSPPCTYKKDIGHASAVLIFPVQSGVRSIPCNFATASGCGRNEVCSESESCECDEASLRSEAGVCTRAKESGRQLRGTGVVTTTVPPASDSVVSVPHTSLPSTADVSPSNTIHRTSVPSSEVSTVQEQNQQQVKEPEQGQSIPMTATVNVASNKVSSPSLPILAFTSAPESPPLSASTPASTIGASAHATSQTNADTVTTIQTTVATTVSATGPVLNSTRPSESIAHTELHSSEPVSTAPTTAPPRTESLVPVVHPVVTAGKNRSITLPKNNVQILATIFPAPEPEEAAKFEFDWTFVSGPSTGQIDSPHSKAAILSDLVVGVYHVHLKVHGPDGAIYEDGLNITVFPKPRVNQPPVASVNPASVTVQYPLSSVVLDASQSHDEFDKTLNYHWRELSWPIGRRLTDYDDTDNSVLKLHDLSVGDYQLQVIVSDSNGAEDSATVNITVLRERDDPPVALAGEPQIIQLPTDSVWLNGNASTDDKGIKSYIWKNLKGPLGYDQSGSSSAYLHLTGLRDGDYVFQLTVTDTHGQSSSSTVSFVVKPANDKPPHVDAGNDMSSPARSMTLEGHAWLEDKGDGCVGCTYRWIKKRAPVGDKSRLSGNTTLFPKVDTMIAGQYIFTLTAKSSQGKAASSDITLTIQNAADINKAPVANAGGDVTIRLPNHMAMLDGSGSSDSDDGINRWLWTRSSDSPAVGDVANGSDHSPMLKLSNLVEGTYRFQLEVFDTFRKSSISTARVVVLPAAFSLHGSLFEIELKEAASDFTENEKDILLHNVANALGYGSSSPVKVYAIDSRLGKVTIVLHIVDEKEDWTAESAVSQLRASQDSLNVNVKKSSVTVERINTFYCLNNCSNHGTCEPLSKQCICDTLWLQNPFKAHFGDRTPNCDWNLLYVAIVNMAILVAAVLLCYGVYHAYSRCTLNRIKLRAKGKKGYSVLKRAESEEDTSLAILSQAHSRGQLQNDSGSEDLLFDTTSLVRMDGNSKTRKAHEGSNGKLQNHKET